MKYKLSISVDEETLKMVHDAIRKRQFRNKSHAFEQCIWEVLANE